MRKFKSGPISGFINGLVIDLAAPANINLGWNLGSLLGGCLALQIATGVLLAGRYSAADSLAFSSIDTIMREVTMGWTLRYSHAIGAGFFLSLAYAHMARGLFFASYKEPRGLLWISGLALFFLVMGTAFLGYVLVWSSMSFWAAVVITNLISSIPKVGVQIVEWIWAGFSVGNPTLVRFYSLHFLLPFAVAALTGVHLILLHENGSSNPIGVKANGNFVRFNPYFVIKDLAGVLGLAAPFIFFLCYEPDMLNHADAFAAADPLVTPATIVPEFYFLPWYAVLRAVPNKLGGVIAMVSGILIIGSLPLLATGILKSSKFRPLAGLLFWALVAIFLLLGWLGQKPAQDPFVPIAQAASLLYFAYFTGVLALAEALEQRVIRG